MHFDLRQWRLPDWASVLGLLIVIFNGWQITRVKQRIVLNLTLNILLQNLRDNSEDMNECLQAYGVSIDRFDATVEACEANVRTARRRLGLQRSRFCSPVLRSMRAYHRERTEDFARQVYNRLQGVVQEVANRADEVRISGS
jgi:pantothenate kinase-related protein Tda10